MFKPNRSTIIIGPKKLEIITLNEDLQRHTLLIAPVCIAAWAHSCRGISIRTESCLASAVRSPTDPLCYSWYCWHRPKPSLLWLPLFRRNVYLGDASCRSELGVVMVKRLLSEGFDGDRKRFGLRKGVCWLNRDLDWWATVRVEGFRRFSGLRGDVGCWAEAKGFRLVKRRWRVRVEWSGEDLGFYIGFVVTIEGGGLMMKDEGWRRNLRVCD